jgi:hypothetical protein
LPIVISYGETIRRSRHFALDLFQGIEFD